MSGGFRVSIPSGLRRTIQNIKEISGSHSDEEVYAMLKECSMDPNEATQKLLLQDTFHEVRRKRDKKKENNREPIDSRWRPGVLGRGGRGGRGSYSSLHVATDAGGRRNVSVGKQNGLNQGMDKGNKSSSSPTTDVENKFSTSTSSSITGLANHPTKTDHSTSSEGCTAQVYGTSGFTSLEESSASGTKYAGSASLISGDVKSAGPSGQSTRKPASVSGVYASTSDPVLEPSVDAQGLGPVGAIKCEVASQSVVVESTINKIASLDVVGSEFSSFSGKGSSELGDYYMLGKMQNKPQLSEAKQFTDVSQAAISSSVTSSTSSRSSSNYSNQSQQLNGPQKVGPSKEWKPKSIHVNPVQPSGIPGTYDAAPIMAETVDRPLPASCSMALDVTTLKLEKRLAYLQLSETQHVIIPHHLQVPESERHGLSFGSFDTSFRLGTGFANGPASEDCSTPPSELSQDTEGNVEEATSSIHNESPIAQEADSADHNQTPAEMPKNLSSREVDAPSGISPAPEFDQSKAVTSSASEGPRCSVVHTPPTYSTFGLAPRMLGSQFASFDSTEHQARDATNIPSFVVSHSFDPSTSYYSQIYRPAADVDGRFSPFLPLGAGTKYNGNIAVLPAQTGQSPKESGNSLVQSSAGPTPLATQAAGVMQSSIAVTQQPVPMFRHPAGVHLSHLPPNYIPFSQYFSPCYVRPHTLHHFLSNAPLPPQPPFGSIYPPPPAAAAVPHVKYPISQYKPGTNIGNSNHVGIPAYGTFNSSPGGYSSSPATGGNSNGNEDLTASRYKENNVYITGQQQSEGSAVWIPAAGHDISGLQVNSFYNLPQDQHLTFAPTQSGHGTLSGVYHPTQTIAATGVHPLLQQSQTMSGAVEVVGPPTGVYQQPQHAQINWANNY